MKSIEVKGTGRTIAERSSEQARALKAIRKNNGDRKSTRLNSSHPPESRMPSSA